MCKKYLSLFFLAALLINQYCIAQFPPRAITINDTLQTVRGGLITVLHLIFLRQKLQRLPLAAIL